MAAGEIYQYGQNGMLLEETDQAGTPQADYIYLNGRPIATLNPATGTLYYLQDDRLGTPQLATDSGQTVAWQAAYGPFGQASVSGSITQNLRFPGQYYDVETGWSHNGFRDYIPQLGRYAEPDPLGRAGSGNDLYGYVGDNAENFVDPLGLQKNCGCGDQQQNKQQNGTNSDKAIPYRLKILGKTQIPPGHQYYGGADYWWYRLLNRAGEPLTSKQYEVLEHVEMTVQLGRKFPDRTSGPVKGMNGYFRDNVGFSSPLGRNEFSENMAIQTFTVLYDCKRYPLTTKFGHYSLWSHGKLTTHVWTLVK